MVVVNYNEYCQWLQIDYNGQTYHVIEIPSECVSLTDFIHYMLYEDLIGSRFRGSIYVIFNAFTILPRAGLLFCSMRKLPAFTVFAPLSRRFQPLNPTGTDLNHSRSSARNASGGFAYGII